MKTMFTQLSTLARQTLCLASLRIMALLLLAVVAGRMQAQYSLTVYDNSAHKSYTTTTSDIKCPFLKSGKLSFNASTGEVTLNSVVYENPRTGVDGGFISLSKEGTNAGNAKIVVKGTNKITCGGNRPIRITNVDIMIQRALESGCTEENCILDLTCSSSTSYGISLNNSSLLVSNATVKVHGGYYGISGEHQNSFEKLSTTDAIIYAQGNTASIGRLGDLQLGIGSVIRKPSGAAFNSSLHGIALGGKLVTDEVLICNSSYVEPGDQTAPTPGTLSLSNTTANSVDLTWTAAQDNVTPQAKLEYQVQYKKSSDSNYITFQDFTKNVTSCTLTGLQVSTAYNVKVNVRDEAGNTASYTVKNFTTSTLYYGIKIGGVSLSSANASEFTCSALKSGTIKFDAETNTLKFDKVVLEGTGHLVQTEDKGKCLNIELTGENSVVSTSGGGFILYGETRIFGSGSLLAEGHTEGKLDFFGIYVPYDGKLTVEDCKIVARGLRGFAGADAINMGLADNRAPKLTFRRAYVTAFGTIASIEHFYEINFDECYLSQPEGASFEKGMFYDNAIVGKNGSVVKNQDVVIEPCKVYIAGKPLMPGKSVSGSMQGTASLDKAGTTLTLNNFCTFVTGEDIIPLELKRIRDFTVKVEGNNAIDANVTAVIAIDHETTDATKGQVTFKGSGVLDITNSKEDSFGFNLGAVDLDVKDIKLIIDATYGVYSPNLALLILITAIFGDAYIPGEGYFNTLNFNCADVYYVGNGGFMFVDGLNLKYCSFTQPVNAGFAEGMIVLGGEQYNGPVTILSTRTTTDIDGVTEKAEAAESLWYTLRGQRVNQPKSRGLYIRDGKKIIVR